MITKIPFYSGSDFLPEVSCHYIDVFKYSVTVSLLSVFGYFKKNIQSFSLQILIFKHTIISVTDFHFSALLPDCPVSFFS